MAHPSELLEALDAILEPARFKDYCPNGLQVEGRRPVRRIISGVTASLALIEAATSQQADAIIVHHGLFWNPLPPITGQTCARISTAIRANLAVYSNHLPLDGHPELGNNALLARQLGLVPDQPFLTPPGSEPVAWTAPFDGDRASLVANLQRHYARVVAVEHGSARPARIAFCSGSGNSAVPELPALGVDTLVTGELREEWYNFAEEHRLNLYCCGHYATEVHGVRALAAAAAEKFGLPWAFIATDNPL